jgi:hypothetical protein
MRRTWSCLGTVALGAAVLGGTLAGYAPASGAVTPTAIASSATQSEGPATATLTFGGSAGLAGRALTTSISCDDPGLAGTRIFLLASPRAAGVGFNIELLAGQIQVIVSTGSGAASRGRVFTGTGVTDFNPAVGAKLNSKLTEVSTPGQKKGSLGAVSSVKGSVNCGNQRPGTSTVTFSGGTAEGTVDGRLNPVRVVCYISAQYGNYVQIQGIIKVGSDGRALLFVTLTKSGLTIAESFAATGSKAAASHFYISQATGSLTLTKYGASVDSSLKEAASAGVAAHTLRMVGKATCGTFVTT